MTVDGRDIQGWLIPGRRRPATARRPDPRRPAHALRLVAVVGVPDSSRPPGSASSTAIRAAPRATARRSTTPTTATGDPVRARDVLAGVDALVADGLADPDRLGLTGGSYGGYLTNWIVGHDQRFRAAMTCRSVNDMGVLFTTGDIAGGDWARLEFETDAVGGPRLLPRDLADRLRRRDPDAAADPALGTRPADDDRPGRGAVHGPALAPPAGPPAARPRGDPRADALRDAVPAGREPAHRRVAGSATS